MNSAFSDFTEQEKIEAFDRIASMYYNVKFGTATKSQLDLLMFSIYLDALISHGEDYSDYAISKQLGLLQTSVRQMKLKKQLWFPREYDWKQAFLQYAEQLNWDDDKVVITIPDPNVMLELQHYIESEGGFVDVQRNTKLLKMSAGSFLKLLLRLQHSDSATQKKDEKEIKNYLRESWREDQRLIRSIENETFWRNITQNEAKNLINTVLGGIMGAII